MGRVICTYLHPLSGADEVSGESRQCVTAVHDGVMLLLCIHVRVVMVLPELM
jgi:hypothetical protein